jgi:hypothetical protein
LSGIVLAMVLMMASLDAFMKFCAKRRPHQGYRLGDRTPAGLLWGAAVTSRNHHPALEG